MGDRHVLHGDLDNEADSTPENEADDADASPVGVDFVPDEEIHNGPWSGARVVPLEGRPEEFLVEDKPIDFFVAICVKQAIEQLNEGNIDCDKDFCLFYVALLEKHCLLHKDVDMEAVLRAAGIKRESIASVAD